MTVTDWNPVLRTELDSPYFKQLQAWVAAERAKVPVYPPETEVFAALHRTPYASVKVVLLGQDPYHGPGQAHGMSFSVRPGVQVPPSLDNMFKELQADLDIPRPNHGCLDHWAKQGVLLLNATLTVRARQAGSHQGKGWERFTDRIIEVVNQKPERVVFLLWGSSARSKRRMIDTRRHVVLEAPHPSPLSAHRGFFGSRPYSRTNQALEEAGRGPIDWHIPNL